MNQREFGQNYYAVLSAIKDSIAMNVGLELRRNNISADVAGKIIHAAQNSVDQIGGNAFDTLSKSGR